MKQEEVKTIVEPISAVPAYIPMMCPVCRGHRTVNWGREMCQVCEGLGFVKVPLEEGEGYGKRK